MGTKVRLFIIATLFLTLMININSRGTSPTSIGINDYIDCTEYAQTSTTTTVITSTSSTSSAPMNAHHAEPNQVTTICTTIIDGCDEYTTETVLITTSPTVTNTATDTATTYTSIATTVTTTNPHLNQDVVTCTNTNTIYGNEQDFALTISNPSDISFEVGERGHQIVWEVDSSNGDYYEISMNGQPFLTNNFLGFTNVIVDLNDLGEGDYLFQLKVADTWGQETFDDVLVTVAPIPITSFPSSSVISMSSSDDDNDNDVPIPIQTTVIFLGMTVSIIVIRVKRS